jgi:hypothetical protein
MEPRAGPATAQHENCSTWVTAYRKVRRTLAPRAICGMSERR